MPAVWMRMQYAQSNATRHSDQNGRQQKNNAAEL
jgi:hypothetical protein